LLDIAIVGGGPAGWSAAITARMRNQAVCVFSPSDESTWLNKADKVENYPGMPGVSGKKLLDTFAGQAAGMGAAVQKAVVRQIMANGGTYLLLAENEVVEARTVILAMGAARPKPLPGETEYLGRGVSYCGTCDGMFYRGKKVAVLSSGEQGLHEANFLAELASEILYFPLKKHDAAGLDARVTMLKEKPLQILGEESGLRVKTDKGAHEAAGVFVFRPAVALDQLLPGLQTQGAFIPVNRFMETNLPGVYAAGDCTGQPLQIAKAVGEGNIAAIRASEYRAAK
jgi:thioredoxin reductase (NADPH)